VPIRHGYRHHARKLFPVDAVREYARGHRAIEWAELRELSWFRDGCAAPEGMHSAFHAELTADRGSWVLCRAHGDLGVHNMLHAADRLWIFDWEESTPDAPVLADRLGFELNGLSRKLRRRPSEWRGIVQRGAPGLSSLPRRDLMLALIFRRSRRMADANVIMKHWDQSDGWGRE
jgi:hypothetical protein